MTAAMTRMFDTVADVAALATFAETFCVGLGIEWASMYISRWRFKRSRWHVSSSVRASKAANCTSLKFSGCKRQREESDEGGCCLGPGSIAR